MNALAQRFCDQPLGHFINGAAVAGDRAEAFENQSPVDERVLHQVAAGTVREVDAAARAAEAAFAGWAATPGAMERVYHNGNACGTEARRVIARSDRHG
ncbi:MAG: aldehyde dehydrogenase family protein [Gammaproteobacteria bacterium]|nr:aldehyde dehydrogenase family protein [Gammaproteobacteria bacterium]